MAILPYSPISTMTEIYATAPGEDVKEAVGRLDRHWRNHR
jgi:hypothetical protein